MLCLENRQAKSLYFTYVNKIKGGLVAMGGRRGNLKVVELGRSLKEQSVKGKITGTEKILDISVDSSTVNDVNKRLQLYGAIISWHG